MTIDSQIIILPKAMIHTVETWCQFHQHFTPAFCANIFPPKNYKAEHNKAAQFAFVQKHSHKTLMKLTPVFSICIPIIKNGNIIWYWNLFFFCCREPHIKFQLLAVLAIAIGHFLDGAVLAYPSPAIPSLNSTASFDFQHMPLVREWIVIFLIVVFSNWRLFELSSFWIVVLFK